MGASRQNVQRIVNDLATDGLVAFTANPHHKRAQLVIVTPKGQDAFDAAMRLQAPWISGLADGLDPADIASTHRVLTALKASLAAEGER
jgi:DNA-binding MarR family transcriptional regulator